MATISKEELISKFENGDLPTGSDFNDLIDSCYNYALSSISLSGYSVLQGAIIFTNVPTVSAGLPSGTVWNNDGFLRIVP